MSGLIVNGDTSGISLAAERLIAGGLVAFPTETVYGLGADATQVHAVSRIFTVKNRPPNHPLIVHIASAEFLDYWAIARRPEVNQLIDHFWPGPLTLILDCSEKFSYLTGGQKKIGLRNSSHPIFASLMDKFTSSGGKGIAAPSANRFGQVSPTNAAEVNIELGKYMEFEKDLILDGGDSDLGIESTIIDCTLERFEILRPGPITTSELAEIVGYLPIRKFQSSTRHSGGLDSHYQPKTPVTLNSKPTIGDALIALDSETTPEGVIRLSCPRDAKEFAQGLYKAFRRADELGVKRLCVSFPVENPEFEAILDRVSKAAQ